MPINEIATEYVHKDGPVVISRGIGREGSPWGAFIKKPNGSLKRFVPVEMQPTIYAVQQALDAYQGKALVKTTLRLPVILKRKRGRFHWVLMCPFCLSAHWIADAGPYRSKWPQIEAGKIRIRCGHEIEIFEESGK